MHAATRRFAIFAILCTGLLAPSAPAHAGPGAPTQLPGARGCINQDGSDGCADGDLLSGAFSVAVSGDGRHAYVALIDARGVAALARDRSTGALTQLPAPTGCTTQTGTGGLCATGRGLHAPLALAVTPDGRHVYVVSQQRDPVTLSSIALFARDTTTGALTQLPGTQGCLSEDAALTECTPAIGIRNAASVAVSRDGRNVYVASETDAVAVFARDVATGALTQLPEPQGCVSQSGSGGHCTQGKALDGASAVVTSKDGRFVYVASEKSRAVAVFARDRSSGALQQLPGEDGCAADDPSLEQCTSAVGLGSPSAIALSPDGKGIYVTSEATHQLAVLARNAGRGTLRGVHCIRDDGSIVCEPAVALRQPYSVAVSRDGRQVYVASKDSAALAVFSRDRRTGSLRQLATPEGCVSDDGSGGLCLDGRALYVPRSVTVSRDGRHVYVAAQGSEGVAVLRRR